ncbi:integrase catalytic domain-containing protein [Trichonephila clavipes]|nr:integrase catalytic domain-containing protein [Trichonephila clavipes]
MLLGYADASESAYRAVVYMHSVKEDGTTTTKLISSKSRVAPIKVISIPRLELSACLLLAQLVEKVRLSLQVHLAKVILHTDSTIAIAWINTPANQLKTFVDNRVSKIQTLTENFEWKHIPSAQNPADIISRGVHPEELSSLILWWNGPQHLDIPEQFIDPSITSSDELYMSELKKQSDISLTSILDSNFENDLLNITNNYMKLIRIFSYIFRFLHNVKNTSLHSGPLTNEELQKAKLHLIKRIQVTVFNKEIEILRNGGTIKKGQLTCLNPFLDKENILRVGGRLSNSDLTYSQKFPILLPKNHKLTILIMNYYHLKNLHVGTQTLLYLVRQEFWPLGGRNTARQIVKIVLFVSKTNLRI